MASIIETTAISLRKGNTESNLSFCGILGELVADLGVDGTGTDPNTTLRLHNGVITGGVPMCRADLLNISTSQLAVGRDSIGIAGEKNLAYADLSNLESSEDASTINNLVNIMKGYGLATTEETDDKLALKANKNFSNIDTADLATGQGISGKHSGKDLAYYDMTNVNSTALTDGTNNLGPVLARADTVNINTANLVDSSIHNNEPAGNKPLMYKDMSNVLSDDLYAALFETHKDALHIEQTTNKLPSYFDPQTGLPLDPSEISADAYPTANAVTAYTEWAIENGSFMQTDINNATSYDPLYSNYKVSLVVPSDGEGNDAYTIHPNNNGPYKYLIGEDGIVSGGSGFEVGHLYTNFVDVSMTTVYDTGNYNQKDKLKVYIESVNSNGIPTSVTIWQNYGVEDLSTYTSITIKDDANNTVTIPLTSTADSTHIGFYKYTAGTPSTTATSCDFKEQDVIAIEESIELNQLFWVLVKEVGNGGTITDCEFYPTISAHYIDISDPEVIAKFDPVVVSSPASGSTNASISFMCKLFVSSIGGAGLVKTDLSNLLGMSDIEAEKAKGTPWRAVIYEAIPSVSNASIDEIQYTNLASNGTVYNALVDAYQKTMGAAAGRETGGALTDVATYVKRTIDQYALSDTYRGQVDSYVATASDLPSTTGLASGYIVLVRNRNSSTNKDSPELYTYNGSSWTHTAFVDTTSASANGDYVYCLDLGNWDTTHYYNVPGNLTWNHSTQRLDVAPDQYNAPDEITIKKDPSTGKIGIAPFYVPSPEFFNGNGVATSFTLSATNCPDGKVPFDVYVDGVFQYPTVSYDFTPSTRVVAFKNSFAPQTGTKNIAIIYRGIIFGTGNNAGPINGHHT